MTDQRIVDYVKSALSNNMPIRQIKVNLISNGWSDLEVSKALDDATQERIFPKAPKHSTSVMIVILFIVIVSAGVFGFYIVNKKEIKPIEAVPQFNLVKDCLDNFDCFIDASKSCKASKLKTGTTSYEIKSMENGKCALYVKALQAGDEGLDGICRFNTDMLAAMLNKWKQGAFSSEDLKAEECEGTMFVQQP